jgi:hypothetical protein
MNPACRRAIIDVAYMSPTEAAKTPGLPASGS